MKKTIIAIILFTTFIICYDMLSTPNLHSDSAVDLMTEIQKTDIAGMGVIVAISNGTVSIDVHEYWNGYYPSNLLHLANAYSEPFIEETNPFPDLIGKTAVFFAVTNDCKTIVDFDEINFRWHGWDLVNCVSNAGEFCYPRFYTSSCPTWFVLENNDSYRLSYLSNITQSVFHSRDRLQYYTALRDAIRPDESGTNPYRDMSKLPLFDLIHESNETNLVIMLNDPLLAMRFRKSALSVLKRDYNWSQTNTVPVP